MQRASKTQCPHAVQELALRQPYEATFSSDLFQKDTLIFSTSILIVFFAVGKG